jgi:hypothetical protein
MRDRLCRWIVHVHGVVVTLYVQDSDFTLYVGDVRDCLRELPDASVHCVVTSPP